MAVSAEDLLPERRLRESYLKHASRAQLHRLWADREAEGPADVFADPAAAETMLVAARGGALPRGDGLRFDLEGGDRIRFASAHGTLTGAFSRGRDVLPRLIALEGAAGAADPLSRAAHRTCGLVHHFIGLVEHPARDPMPFRELLGGSFSLGYTAAPISDLTALDAWVRGALSSVVASEHVIHSVDVEDLGGADVKAQVRMTSQALFPDGSGAISRNTQTWTLHDADGDRFPRISEILIARDAVEFFGPAPLFEPRERP